MRWTWMESIDRCTAASRRASGTEFDCGFGSVWDWFRRRLACFGTPGRAVDDSSPSARWRTSCVVDDCSGDPRGLVPMALGLFWRARSCSRRCLAECTASDLSQRRQRRAVERCGGSVITSVEIAANSCWAMCFVSWLPKAWVLRSFCACLVHFGPCCGVGLLCFEVVSLSRTTMDLRGKYCNVSVQACGCILCVPNMERSVSLVLGLLFSVRYLLWCCAQHDGDHESTFPVVTLVAMVFRPSPPSSFPLRTLMGSRFGRSEIESCGSPTFRTMREPKDVGRCWDCTAFGSTRSVDWRRLLVPRGAVGTSRT